MVEEEYVVFEVAGTIRPDKLGRWFVLDNADHVPINFADVSVTNEYIKLGHEHALGVNNVVTMIVTPDETMAKEEVRVGISVGLNFSYIYLGLAERNITTPCVCKRYDSATC